MFEFLASFGLLSCSQSDNQTNVKVNESVNDKTFNDLKDLESTSLHITRQFSKVFYHFGRRPFLMIFI